MSRDINPFGLRMPADLKRKLEETSSANGRSMNAEIVARLQASFEDRTPPIDERMVEVGKAVVEFLQCHMDTPTDQLPGGLQSFVHRVGVTGRLVSDEAEPKPEKNSRSSA